MHERVSEFVDTAEQRYGLSVEPVEFPEKGTPTAADAAEAVGCDIAQIVKSLVFSVDGGEGGAGESAGGETLVLCLTSGAERVDEAALAAWAGVEASAASMANPEQVRDATGWAIGGVPPVCHENELPALLDPALLDHDTIWGAAGTATSMWEIDPERLQSLADAEVVAFTE